ncbi:hypothetical protein [Paenibacillus faecalis]|uniref:hypothetical protein n=1 Tax=Paenibacillus faecalis TaxID=2079532 RepID=UPI000D0F44D0|nr:hypothetical protein [Paenibacillus faecalis]
MNGTGEETNVIVFGLGPIGLQILKSALLMDGMNVIGAIDIDPAKVSRDIGELTGLERKGVAVVRSARDIVPVRGHTIAIHATGSHLPAVWPQIKELIECGCSVVSTCEQLAYPWHRYPELAKQIDEYARKHSAVIVGTGVNPGYIMDMMALFLTATTTTISQITVTRAVDVRKRRLPLQKKVGIGMSPQQFHELAQADRIGHVGLEESLRLIAHGLCLQLGDVENSIEPVLAEESLQLDWCDLQPGDVIGLWQTSAGMAAEGVRIRLDLTMALDAKQADRIVIVTADDQEQVEMVVPNGIFGDTATAAMAINTAKLLSSSVSSGLLTMVDVGLLRNVSKKRIYKLHI